MWISSQKNVRCSEKPRVTCLSPRWKGISIAVCLSPPGYFPIAGKLKSFSTLRRQPNLSDPLPSQSKSAIGAWNALWSRTVTEWFKRNRICVPVFQVSCVQFYPRTICLWMQYCTVGSCQRTNFGFIFSGVRSCEICAPKLNPPHVSLSLVPSQILQKKRILL